MSKPESATNETKCALLKQLTYVVSAAAKRFLGRFLHPEGHRTHVNADSVEDQEQTCDAEQQAALRYKDS
jgi:hypothetical protein